MSTFSGTLEGQPTPSRTIETGDTRYPNGRPPNITWTNDAVLALVKTFVGLLATQRLKEGDIWDRAFNRAGVTEKWLHQEVTRFFPWLDGYVHGKYGVEVTPHILYDRMHKQFYRTAAKGQSYTVARSSEHYSNHPKLRRYQPIADRIALAGRSVTLPELTSMVKGLNS